MGGFYEREVIDTIDGHIACQHILIVETEEENDEREMRNDRSDR